MEKYDDENGVWRTIRGRRVFIRDGESLGQAMARSGKFKREDIREGRKSLSSSDRNKKTLDEQGNYKSQKTLEKQKNKFEARFGNKTSKNQAEKNRINENAHIEGGGKTRVQRNWNKYSEADRTEHRHELIQKKLADYKAKKQSNVKIKEGNPIEDLANDRIKEKQNTLNNDKAMLEAMKRKGIKEVNGWTQKDFENRINKNEDYLKQSNNKNDLVGLKKEGNTYIPIRKGENEKDVVDNYKKTNNPETMSRMKDAQHEETLRQQGIRTSLGENSDREVAEAQKRKGTLVELKASDLKTKTTKEIMDMKVPQTKEGKKAFNKFIAENRSEIAKELKNGDYNGNSIGNYMKTLSRQPKENDIILGGGDNGEDVRVGKNGKLEVLTDDDFDSNNVYVGKKQKIEAYKKRKGK